MTKVEELDKALGGHADAFEITPEMIEAGLEWLLFFNRDYSDGRREVGEILRAALSLWDRGGVALIK